MGSLDTQLNNSWMADFESTTTADDCRVWLWGVCGVFNTDLFIHGTDIGSFCEWLWSESNVVFFHNAAFDTGFLMDYIMKEGYKWVPENPRSGQFTTLISNMGKFYSMEIHWTNGRTTEIRDSLKKLPMSVKAVAKAFKLAEGKGEIDYKLHRPKGWIPTAEELDYLRRDLQIPAQALAQQIREGMTKLTVGADSLEEYKSLISKKVFDRNFPVLGEDMDAEIRMAYRGGFTYADHRFSGKRQKCGKVYDVNSLYPYIMYDRLLPYGTPNFFDGAPKKTKTHPLWIASITFMAKLKKKHIPCIQVKNNRMFLNTEYQTLIDEPTTMYCTNVDWELWNDHYDITVISYNGGWSFRGNQGFFQDFIDKWMKIKANSEGGMRAIAKLHLNSLYGKFATNPNVTGKYPVLEDDVVKLKTGEPETRNPVYTAMGVFITAYARSLTITAAQQNYDVFAYADTDSLHLLTTETPQNLDVHPSNLGAWKCEGEFDEALYMRPKAYCEHMVKDEHGNDVDFFSTHIAGVPESITDNLVMDDLVSGTVFVGKDYKKPVEGRKVVTDTGKLTPVRVPGGIILEDVGFTLKF